MGNFTAKIKGIYNKHKSASTFDDEHKLIRFEKMRVMLRLWGLTTAELVDAWRIGPRLFVAAYAYVLWDTINWYMNIPSTATTPNMAQATLVSAVFGAASVIFAFYVNTGRKWGDNPNIANGAYASNLNIPVPAGAVTSRPDISSIPPSVTPPIVDPAAMVTTTTTTIPLPTDSN